MNYLLIGVVLFFILVTANGFRKGLLKSVLFCGTTILALFATSQCYQFVGKALNEYTGLGEQIETSIEKSLEMKTNETKKIKRAEQTKKIESLNLPQGIKDALVENNNMDIYKALNVTSFYEYIASYLSKLVINAISYFLTFILSSIIIGLLIRVLDFITEIPILKEINKIGGLCLGAIEGLIGIWIFFLIVTIWGSTTFGETMFRYINDSTVLSFLYDNNIILNFITNMSKVLF